MSAISNGLALHGGFIPYDATFLVFSDYARNAVRMSALIPAHAIHVYTHDSIGLGEDGPTHQPIEHLASLRYIPNNHVWRPCDAVESAVAWKAAIERANAPSCLVFSRQNLAHQHRTDEQLAAIARGGYVLADPGSAKFDAILIATGSEVDLAMQAMRKLADEGIAVRVVSMPCTNVFDAQPVEYRESVLPAGAASASRSKPASPISGASTSASTARSSASTRSARRRRPKRCSSTSGSRSSTSSRRSSRCADLRLRRLARLAGASSRARSAAFAGSEYQRATIAAEQRRSRRARRHTRRRRYARLASRRPEQRDRREHDEHVREIDLVAPPADRADRRACRATMHSRTGRRRTRAARARRRLPAP